MSEALHLPEFECARALGMIARFVDRDLAAAESAWFGEHLEDCAECRAALLAFAEMDCELTAWGKGLGRQNPPAAGAREQLAARVKRRRNIIWLPAAIGAVAAAVALVLIMPHRTPIDRDGSEGRFVEIPYLPPLDPRENAAVVRMNIRVATLMEAGFRVAADPDKIVPADVLVGEDGRAHAVRLLSDIEEH